MDFTSKWPTWKIVAEGGNTLAMKTCLRSVPANPTEAAPTQKRHEENNARHRKDMKQDRKNSELNIISKF